MKEICLSFLVLLAFRRLKGLEQTCPQGYRLSEAGSGICLPCKDGLTYLSENVHTHTQCQNCSKIENLELELLITECNKTHDTVILCRPGYYRSKARSILEKDKCEKCSQCQFPARPCQGFHDSICCLPGQDSMELEGRVIDCKERSFLCGQGHYFSALTNECLPCPEGTFMNEDNQTNIACRKCETLSGDRTTHAVITHPCNRTSPTLFGCESGFFRDSTNYSLMVEVECFPCQKCAIEARQCDMYHNTVCFNSDNFTVPADQIFGHNASVKDQNLVRLNVNQQHISGTSTSNEEQDVEHSASKQEPHFNVIMFSATDNSTVCGQGFYRYVNISEGSSVCKPCDNETSTSSTTPACEDCIHYISECHKTKDLYIAHTDFRIFSILLFSLAVLVDIFYVLLYGHNFLRKSSYIPRRNCSQTGQDTSRLVGTAGIDLHIVFMCVHFFGILCEVGVVTMDEAVLWKFTVIMGIVSIIVYFIDAVLFLLVKRVLCVNVCVSYGPHNANNRVHYRSGEEQAFLDIT